MTRLWNDPDDFVDEMIAGFVAANGAHVRRVSGGVVRSTEVPEGQVAVVIGGGSGHYPAFGGLVGRGLAHGAAMGNLFASPSTQQVLSVATAAERGGGVLFSYGRYAGDVLNFDAAQARLRADGIPCETVLVTDDVASAPDAERETRRGIAGDLVVFRIASAAAEAGADLAEVARVARRANDLTRSFGVAFSGCTLPGAPTPLFEVPPGRMAIGLGIHGEPGIDEVDVPTADGLAELLVTRLLAEAPADAGARVVPILNGLGSLKYEELFVVYGRIARLLQEAGLDVVDPHVGEYCTSFDMAGGSLTLFWPDAELEELWAVPVDTPAYRRGSMAPAVAAVVVEGTTAEAQPVPPADAASRAFAADVVDALAATVAVLETNVDELGRLDAIAGDGDHGLGMLRGARAALDAARVAADAGAGSGTTLERAADAWSDRAGGASGVLWGLMLAELARALGDEGRPDAGAVSAGLTAAAQAVTAHGGAEVGDKTLVDALVPFRDAFASAIAAGSAPRDAWRDAAAIATGAAADTAVLPPRVGRARTHTEKSVGTPDPGATSLALIVTAVGETLAGNGASHA